MALLTELFPSPPLPFQRVQDAGKQRALSEHQGLANAAPSERNRHSVLDIRTRRRILQSSVIDNAQLTHTGMGGFRLGIYEPDG
jgi:hypothetical protein